MKIDILSFSGGTGSSAILWMVLKGLIPKPENFYVIVANPGMENPLTLLYVDEMEKECRKAGIEFIRAKGPNLFVDLYDKTTWIGKTRLDNPPFWTRDRITGKKGRLRQKCTGVYKIAPMDRMVRMVLERDLGISRKTKRLPNECVVRWIGFTADEWHRMSEPLAALCPAHGMDMKSAGEIELSRIIQPEIVEKIRAKQAKKPTGSALPAARSYPPFDCAN